jgi:shikimate dehydrogenase
MAGERIQMKGYNTDYIGFRESLDLYLTGSEKFAVILGDGGASKAVEFALSGLGLELNIVTRKHNNKNNNKNLIQYGDLNRKIVHSADLIINTTPLGTWPDVETFPDIPYQFIKKDTIAFDLVYNPPKTKFLSKCEEFGAIIVNGFDMLKIQAEKAWTLFNDIQIH